MKRYVSLVLVLISTVLLMSCAHNRYPYLNQDLTKETWTREVDTNANKWTKGADRWFLTGDPSATEIADRNSPYSDVISTMQVKVPDFTQIKVDGNFQVQIFGTYGPNSVYVFGPNDGVRQVVVTVKDNTLLVRQASKNPPTCMKRVIIRIGVSNLNCLTQLGNGSIEGIQVRGNNLRILSSGPGDIYLAGNLDVSNIENTGNGDINVFGANTRRLKIMTKKDGSVNVSGNVGVNNITHHGTGDINIIGVYTDSLNIDADGKGKVGLYGRANVKNINARDNVRVYVYQVTSTTLYVNAYNYSIVGLAGCVGDLYEYASGSAQIESRYLRAATAFVRAQDNSHINVTASDKIFAAATRNSSVYFYGEPRLLSQFVSGNGVVIPVWYDTPRTYPRLRQNASYKDQNVYPRYRYDNSVQ